MENWKSTAAQARYCAYLESETGYEKFQELYNRVCNGQNRPTNQSETVIKAVRRLTKKNASKLIDLLKKELETPTAEVEEREPSENTSSSVSSPLCPQCCEPLETNTFEAWCYNCNFHIDKNHSQFTDIRDAHLAWRKENAKKIEAKLDNLFEEYDLLELEAEI